MHALLRCALPSARAGRTASVLAAGLATGLATGLGLVLAVSPAHADAGLPTSTTTAVSPVAAASTSLAPAGPVAALPAPVGFGAATTGGAGGAVVHVTSATDGNGTEVGTLRWALAQPGPRWIVFDGDLTITLLAPLPVSSDTTIDGRGHHVLVTGHGTDGLVLNGVSNVVVEGLELRDFGDTALTSLNDPHDAISVSASSRVWIDHNTLSEAADKLIGIQNGSTQVTVSWNHFWDQQQTLQIGSMATAAADVRQTVTVSDNWFDHVGYRLPVASYGKVHVYNNFMDSWGQYAVRSERLAQVYLEANVFQAAASKKATTTDVGQDCNDTGAHCDSRPGYLYDTGNLYLGKTVVAASDQADVFDPHQAYAYSAAPATPGLAAAVASGAGSGPAGGHVVTLAPPSPGSAGGHHHHAQGHHGSRHGGRHGSGHGGHGHLALTAHGGPHRVSLAVTSPATVAGARVTFTRRAGHAWITVGTARLDRHGWATLTVTVGSARSGAAQRYRATVSSRTFSGTSNAVRVD